MKKKVYILLFIAGIITFNIRPQALLRGVTETVEKATEGATDIIEGTTEKIVPPVEPIVEAPLDVAKKTTTAVADVFREPSTRTINNAKPKPESIKVEIPKQK